MQAQPRGKKRGAKENIDAGVKKSKKEESKLYVCAIYRRDIASFLPREKIQEWRLTSSFSNASLSEFPSLLPSFKYYTLRVIFASADRCRVKKDGFLHHQSDFDAIDGDEFSAMGGKEFSSIFDFRFCCRDVKDRASVLTGKRLFPNKPDDEGVAFKLYTIPEMAEDSLRGKGGVVCSVPNLLTKMTAQAMLHFLHHLSQGCYEYVEIFPGATADAAECAFNPLVLQVLPKFRLRGVKFGRANDYLWRSGELSNLTAKMASEMRIRFNLLSYYYSDTLVADPPWLLDFIANGRELDKRLELEGDVWFVKLDQIIKFEEDMHSLEGAIRDVHYESFDYGSDWPARCPVEAAEQVTRNGDGTVDYRFNYVNAHSGEPFSLMLKTRRQVSYRGEEERVVKFRITLGSA